MHCESTDGSVQYHILILILYEIPFCAINKKKQNKLNTSKKLRCTREVRKNLHKNSLEKIEGDLLGAKALTPFPQQGNSNSKCSRRWE